MIDPRYFMILAVLGALLLGCGLVLGRRRRRRPQSQVPVGDDPTPAPSVPRLWIMAQVWPREHATPEQLRALGQALEAWQARHPCVAKIEGLDNLLSGEYPPPDGLTPYEETILEEPVRPRFNGAVIEYGNVRRTVVDPWKYCPAMVWSGEGMEGEDAIGSLKRSIPPELVSGIGLAFW